MTDDSPLERDEPAGTDLPPQLVALEQRRHLRRILRGFVALIVLLPFAGLGGAWAYLILPALAAAFFASREAMLLRRSVRRYGAVREP
jgi:hypothetical protein